jgi:MFS family permease
VYVGALLGPFGAGVVAPALPQISHSLHVSVHAAAISLTAYLTPLAAVQLVSGTLGERWGRERTVLIAYLVYLVAALGAMLAPNLAVFLSMRVVLGLANGFTSPLLLAGLADIVAPRRLSRSVGIFASCQAAGQSVAPLVGGLAAAQSWRWAFLVVAITAGLLALAPPPGKPRPGLAAPPWRPLIGRSTALLAVAALASYLGAAGLPFLVALHAQDHLAMSPGNVGLALLGFGVAGLLLGSFWGSVTERLRPARCGVVGAVLAAGAVVLTGLSTTPATLVLWWTLAGAAASMINVALQNLTVRAVPANRGGALSAVSAFRFSGAALAPPCLLPIYAGHPRAAFVVAGSALLLVAVVLIMLPRSRAAAA